MDGGETVSIDLSKKIPWTGGRENFALNGIDTTPHRSYAGRPASRSFPPRAQRKSSITIVLDPPTFRRGNKGRRFQVEEEMESLLTRRDGK